MKRLAVAGLISSMALLSGVDKVRAEGNFSIGGYYKNFTVGYELPGATLTGARLDLPPLGSVSNRLRIQGDWTLHDNLRLQAAYDIGPVIQDRLLNDFSFAQEAIDPFSYRVDDLDPRLYPDPGDPVRTFTVMHNLDRLSFEWRTGLGDLYIGRQAIAFGSARVINPTDILAPFSYETLDTEDRIGIDAVRLRIPIGFMGEVDAGYLPGKKFDFENSAFFLRTRRYFSGNDITIMAVGYRENLMVGLSLARSIGGAGTWLEAAYNWADVLTEETSRGAEDFLRFTVGTDYNFGGQTYAFVEYHFSQAGADDADEYPGLGSSLAYREGSVYLMGRHYLIPGVNYQFTPLITGSAEVLWNISDLSAYIAPRLEYNLADNVYLSGGMFVGLGKGADKDGRVGSEFAAYPDIFYTSFRIYF